VPAKKTLPQTIIISCSSAELFLPLLSLSFTSQNNRGFITGGGFFSFLCNTAAGVLVVYCVGKIIFTWPVTTIKESCQPPYLFHHANNKMNRAVLNLLPCTLIHCI
jgi:hypothetical protein